MRKKKEGGLVTKFLSGTLTEKQLIKLQTKIITIQAFWRGFKARKAFAKKLNDESTKIRYLKNRI